MPMGPAVLAFPGSSVKCLIPLGAGVLTFTLAPFALPVLALTVLAVVHFWAPRSPVRWLLRRSRRRGGGPPIARQALPSLLGPAMASRKDHVAALGFSSVKFDPAAPA